MRKTSQGLIALGFSFAGFVHGALAQEALTIPHFVEETKSAGIHNDYKGAWQYMVGGGVATFDCNADGFPDMVLAGGELPAKFYRNIASRGGALKFVAQKSGLELDHVTGAYPLDIDGDGITDLVLLRVGETVLMRGLGNCKFERANAKWGFDGGDAWWTAFSATWEHGAPWPTLATGSYIDRSKEIDPWGSCTDNRLYRPKAVAGKPEQFDAPVPLKPSFCTLSMLFTDWNRSGTPSLRVTNDREYYKGGQEQLWRIEPGKAPTPFTAADGWKPLKIWGMGIASADLNGDGYPDYFLTSMADNKLQTLTAADAAAKPDYKDVALAKGVTAQHPYDGGDVRPSTAWHAQFEDVNNDGRADLFVAKGNVDSMPDFATKDPNDLLIQGVDGKFVEVGDKAGIDTNGQSRGAMLADFNLDGLLDLVVVNRNAPAQLWRNTTPDAGHWLDVQLSEDGPNRDAIGATIEVKAGSSTMRREITVGGGHASGQLGWWHFGLRSATTAEISVIWPDGTKSEPEAVNGDGFYVVSPRKAAAWVPGKGGR